MKALFAALMTFVALLAPPHAQANPITIDNGVTGDGAWQVVVEPGGDSFSGILDPAGSIGPSDVIFNLSTLVDPGADGGAVALSSSSITGFTLSAPGQVSSSGSFAGANGPVNWNSVSTIAPGSLTYQNTVTFTSAMPFGTLRVLCYLDEDVAGSSDDIMVPLGTPGQANFNVLTVDNTDNFGVAHAAGYLTATNATYIGWAADEYSDLINAIANQGTTYSIPGVIDTTSLPLITDARYPGRMVYGPNDITNAFAFDVTPTATTATIACSLGGLPTGQLPALTIAKTAAGAVANGSDLVYTLRYANTGPAATGVVIRDRLPMGATFVSASNGGTLAGDTVTWAIGDVPANSGERTLTLTVRVSGVAGSIITNADYSISGTGLSMVAGAPVSTTITAASVIVPPIVPSVLGCTNLPLTPDALRDATFELSSDGNFLFQILLNVGPRDPRCLTLGRFCVGVQEVTAFDRSSGTRRALTSNSPQGWENVYALSGNRAWVVTGTSGFNYSYAGRQLASATYSGTMGSVPATRGDIRLVNAATGASLPLMTPFRMATAAAGLSWSGHFQAASYDGNSILLVEFAYDDRGALVDGGLHLVDIPAQTSFDLFNRIQDLSGQPQGLGGPDFPHFFQLSGNGNRISFSSNVVLTGTSAGTRVIALPGNAYGLRELAYVFDRAANALVLVAQPNLSQPRVGGGSSLLFVRELGATGTLVALDRTVPFLGTPGNPDGNSEIYIAQPGLGISQITNTAPPPTGNLLSPGLGFMTPNERFVYFNAEQNLVGRNADRSNEVYRYDVQTGSLRQVTNRIDARADLLAFLGLTQTDSLGNELVPNETSFDGRFLLITPTGPTTSVSLGGGAYSVVAEQQMLFDCQ